MYGKPGQKKSTDQKQLLAVQYDWIVEETVGIVGGIKMVKQVRFRNFFYGMLKNLKIIFEILRAVNILLFQRKNIK